MKRLKLLFMDMLGMSEKEYSKKWMSRFTSAVLAGILFNIILFFALLSAHLHFGLSYRMCKMFWDKYMTFSGICISAYSVTWLGHMGKAYLAKREEEKLKLQYKLGILDGSNESDSEEETYEN